MMNKYGQLALDYVSRTRPASLATITDPTSHCTRVGDQIQDEITSFQETLVGQRMPHESLGAFRSRGDRAMQQAEEIVLRETLTAPAGMSVTPLSDDPEVVTHRAGLSDLARSMSRLSLDWTEVPPDQP